MDLLYKNLLELLDAEVSELKWIDYDQGQIDYPQKNYPIPFPAVLIDFENVEWEDVGQNVQGGVVTVSIRVAMRIWHDLNNHTPETSRNAGLDNLKLLNLIHAQIQNHSGDHYNGLSRVRQYTEKRDDALKVVVMQYQTYLRDQHAMTTYTKHIATDLEILK